MSDSTKRRNEIDAALKQAFADLRRVIDEYEVALSLTEPPFTSYQFPDRVRVRLKVIGSLNDERHEAMRAEKQPA